MAYRIGNDYYYFKGTSGSTEGTNPDTLSLSNRIDQKLTALSDVSDVSASNPNEKDRFLVNNKNLSYTVSNSAMATYSTDGISFIRTANGKYAYLEPVGGKFLFSQFIKIGDNDAQTLQRAINYIYYRGLSLPRHRFDHSYIGDTTLTTPSELFIDRTINVTDSIYVWSNTCISSNYSGGDNSIAIHFNLNNANKPAFILRNGWGGAYNSAIFKNLNLIFDSPAITAFWLFRPTGEMLNNVKISGGNVLINGIVVTDQVFFYLKNVYIYDITGTGVLFPIMGRLPKPYNWMNERLSSPVISDI
jgi:hypothetical protein